MLNQTIFTDGLLIALNSFEENKVQLILIDGKNSKIKTNITIDLELNVNKVLMDIGYDNDISKIDLFQSQCNPETGDCRILRQEVNLIKKSTLPFQVIANINATECKLTDIFKSDSSHYKLMKEKYSISYACKRDFSNGPENGTDYFFRVVEYSELFKIQDVTSFHMSVFGFTKLYDRFLYKEFESLFPKITFLDIIKFWLSSLL